MIEPIHAVCPWCGADRIEASAYLNNVNYKMWRAKCKNCGATGPSEHTSEVAMARWYDRDLPKPEPEKVPIPIEPHYVPTGTLDKCGELANLARRLVEMMHCLCVEGLKCVPCRIREILLLPKGKT